MSQKIPEFGAINELKTKKATRWTLAWLGGKTQQTIALFQLAKRVITITENYAA